MIRFFNVLLVRRWKLKDIMEGLVILFQVGRYLIFIQFGYLRISFQKAALHCLTSPGNYLKNKLHCILFEVTATKSRCLL